MVEKQPQYRRLQEEDDDGPSVLARRPRTPPTVLASLVLSIVLNLILASLLLLPLLRASSAGVSNYGR